MDNGRKEMAKTNLDFSEHLIMSSQFQTICGESWIARAKSASFHPSQSLHLLKSNFTAFLINGKRAPEGNSQN